jgi:hypothetical protein
MGNIMSYGTGAMDVVQSSTTGTPTQFQDGSGTQIGTLCRAWVNFNGTNGASPVIRASFNVGSVTYVSTGTYKVNFSTALADANYAPVAMAQGYPAVIDGAFTQTSSAVQFYVFYATNTGGGQAKYDANPIGFAAFR